MATGVFFLVAIFHLDRARRPYPPDCARAVTVATAGAVRESTTSRGVPGEESAAQPGAMRPSRVGEMGAVAVSLAGRAGEDGAFDGGCRWSTLPKAVSMSRRQHAMPRTAWGSTALSAYGSVRKSSMRVFTPEICADTRPATKRPVPTMVPMIGFASVLTELQRTTVRANRARSTGLRLASTAEQNSSCSPRSERRLG